ncbi:MAG: PspC domain-containing protein [Bacillota bacterium]|jgi:phage shock protein C|nr:PspC domain-containing protein [Bacillota bacterium]
MSKRLYRSQKNRLLSGVCGGLGEYLSIDPVVIRLAFAMFLIFRLWLGLIAYGLAALLIPMRGSTDFLEAEVVDHPHRDGAPGFQGKLAIVLILAGIGLLLYRFIPRTPLLLGYIRIFKEAFWPLALIVLGLWLIFRSKNR